MADDSAFYPTVPRSATRDPRPPEPQTRSRVAGCGPRHARSRPRVPRSRVVSLRDDQEAVAPLPDVGEADDAVRDFVCVQVVLRFLVVSHGVAGSAPRHADIGRLLAAKPCGNIPRSRSSIPAGGGDFTTTRRLRSGGLHPPRIGRWLAAAPLGPLEPSARRAGAKRRFNARPVSRLVPRRGNRTDLRTTLRPRCRCRPGGGWT